MRVRLLAATTLGITFAAISGAVAQTGFGSGVGIGVSANGTCRAGVCPPTPTPVSTSYILPYSFDLTLPNGDSFRVAGHVSVGGNGLSCGGTQTFGVTYLGNPSNSPSQADTLTLHNLWACNLTGNPVATTHHFSASFSSGVAATSSVTSSATYNSVTFPTRSATPPNPFTTTDFMSVPAAGTFAHDATYTVVFGAGSAIGSTIWTGFDLVTPGTLVAAVLPTARTSSATGPDAGDGDTTLATFATVTAFATMINAGSNTATNCSVQPPLGVQGNFLFQTTNPATNTPTGSPNTLVDIPAGQSQSFFFALTPSAPFTQDIAVLFNCTNRGVFPNIPGVNTFLLTSSNTPIPDLVSIAVTPTGDGILRVPLSSTTAFAEAAVNIAAGGNVTFTPSFTPVGQPTRTLPVGLSICQTNSSGTCINPPTPAPAVTVNITNNQTSTFTVFAQGQGQNVAFDPANNRIHIIATQGSTVVGATSVAVQAP